MTKPSAATTAVGEAVGLCDASRPFIWALSSDASTLEEGVHRCNHEDSEIGRSTDCRCLDGHTILARWSPWVFGVCACGYALLRTYCPAFRAEANSRIFNGFYYTIISIAGLSVLTYVVLRPGALISRFLKLRPIVWLGAISYGVYLYSGIIQAAALKILHSPYPAPLALGRRLFVPDLAVIIVISWISFKFYEHPIVLWGKRKADHQEGTEKQAWLRRSLTRLPKPGQ